jgi:hypothetical protein
MLHEKITRKWKIHLIFFSLLPIAFALEFAIRFLSGSAVAESALAAVKQINLFWLLFYLALWYTTTTGRLESGEARKRQITTLNLNDREN